MDFPKRRLIMLPGPTNVPDRISNAMIKPMINHRGETFTLLLEGITEKAKRLFQTEHDALILSASGTGGVEAAVWNLVRPGDRVLVPVFGEFGSRLAETVEEAGGKAINVTSKPGTIPPLDEIERAAKGVDGLKGIFIVHNETSTGCAVPYLERLGGIARDLGAFFVVDAVSSLGGYAIPVDRWGIDICVTGSQKCLAAPPGLSLLSLSEKARSFVESNRPKIRYFDLARQLEFLARGETPYTPAIPLYYALDEALEMFVEEGLEQRVSRHTRHARTFYSVLDALKLRGFADEAVRSNTVISVVYPDGIEDRVFRKKLMDEHDIVVGGGFGALKGKLFRIGSMGDVGTDHVNRTAAGIAVTLEKLGYPVEMRKVTDALLQDVD